jgi:hypothetical protein
LFEWDVWSAVSEWLHPLRWGLRPPELGPEQLGDLGSYLLTMLVYGWALPKGRYRSSV